MKIIADGKEITLGETVPSDTPIQTEIWRRVLDVEGKPSGRIFRVAGRPVAEVARDLCNELERLNLIDEYAGVGHEYKYDNAKCPDTPTDWPDNLHNIACYAVIGGSEGHYVHVDMVLTANRPNTRAQHVCLALIKTFRGMGHAREIAAKCYYLLTGIDEGIDEE